MESGPLTPRRGCDMVARHVRLNLSFMIGRGFRIDRPRVVRLLDEHTDGHTRMVIETTFPSTDAMERLVTMGMEEGMSLALGQIDDLLRTYDR
jgi:hypothetical protein